MKLTSYLMILVISASLFGWPCQDEDHCCEEANTEVLSLEPIEAEAAETGATLCQGLCCQSTLYLNRPIDQFFMLKHEKDWSSLDLSLSQGIAHSIWDPPQFLS